MANYENSPAKWLSQHGMLGDKSYGRDFTKRIHDLSNNVETAVKLAESQCVKLITNVPPVKNAKYIKLFLDTNIKNADPKLDELMAQFGAPKKPQLEASKSEVAPTKAM